MKIIVRNIILSLILLSIYSFKPINSQTEYEVKTIFIDKFIKYITWPNQSNRTDFNIYIFQPTPMKGITEKYFLNSKAGDRIVNVFFIENIEDILDLSRVDIIFISTAKQYSIKAIVDKTKYLPILLISESIGMAKKGVHLNYYFAPNGTIHFEMAPLRFEDSGLKYNSLLLEYAKVIR